MSDFRTLPVDEAIAWIRAWTDRVWPITLEEAFAIRDSLGWQPSLQEPRYFTTKISVDGKEDGMILRSNEFGIKGLNFNLSTSPPLEPRQSNLQATYDAYSQYIDALRQACGPGKTVTNTQETTHTRWTLPNGVSISVIRANTNIGVDIDSPWRTQLKAKYARIVPDNE